VTLCEAAHRANNFKQQRAAFIVAHFLSSTTMAAVRSVYRIAVEAQQVF
jgi:hypothetical protein